MAAEKFRYSSNLWGMVGVRTGGKKGESWTLALDPGLAKGKKRGRTESERRKEGCVDEISDARSRGNGYRLETPTVGREKKKSARNDANQLKKGRGRQTDVVSSEAEAFRRRFPRSKKKSRKRVGGGRKKKPSCTQNCKGLLEKTGGASEGSRADRIKAMGRTSPGGSQLPRTSAKREGGNTEEVHR